MNPLRRRLLGTISALPLVAIAAPKPRKILIVSTNVAKVGENTSGTYLPEIAYPFQVFLDNGFEVDVVTPQGGKAAIYHVGNKREELAAIEASAAYRQKVARTLAPGHGQYFDVVRDAAIARLTAAIHRNGGVVGTAGHGIASLVEVKTAEGAYLVAGKRITCFPTWAEKKWMNISGFGALLPFDMEEVLRARGADLVVCTEATRDDPALTLVTDEAKRFVTGAFASGARPVAIEMARLLRKG